LREVADQMLQLLPNTVQVRRLCADLKSATK
jgi:hypothetical protein